MKDNQEQIAQLEEKRELLKIRLERINETIADNLKQKTLILKGIEIYKEEIKKLLDSQSKDLFLKGNLFIAGFDTNEELELASFEINDAIVYEGETSEISEELASNLCSFMFWDEQSYHERRRFYNYGKRSVVSYPFLTGKESIESACKQKYCLIYRTK
jgi:hypothetical protein